MSPPIVRNLPVASGSITWQRHLFHRASGPLEQFPRNLLTTSNDPTKKVKQVGQYHKIVYTLYYFEWEWRKRWMVEVDKAKAGLLATLIIRHPNNNKLYVNFDSEIMTLIREAKCLSRIGIEIPESAKIVLLQEEKFKIYNSELTFVLGEYDRIVNKIRPNTKSLLVPHLEDLEYKLRPGMNILTWTSMNIDGYLAHVHQGLSKLEQLIININDIMENRIENNLKALSKTVLVNLPIDSKTYTLDEFVEMQSEWIDTESKKLKSKNIEVEQAVEDLINTICSYSLDEHVEAICSEEIQKLSKYYSWSMYQALLHATKYSLNQMKERICGRRNLPKQVLKPFFSVDVSLDGNKSVLKPSLDEVQSAINRAASHVLKSTKKVQLVPERHPRRGEGAVLQLDRQGQRDRQGHPAAHWLDPGHQKLGEQVPRRLHHVLLALDDEARRRAQGLPPEEPRARRLRGETQRLRTQRLADRRDPARAPDRSAVAEDKGSEGVAVEALDEVEARLFEGPAQAGEEPALELGGRHQADPPEDRQGGEGH